MERGQVGSLFCHCMSWLFTFLQHNLACMIFISPSLSPSDLEMGVRNSTEVMGIAYLMQRVMLLMVCCQPISIDLFFSNTCPELSS